MRITRQTLSKIASDTVIQRVRSNRNLTAAYLCGSVVDENHDPALGSTADIDLVFVHDFDPPGEREIIRLTPDVHIDLRHHESTRYRQARQLRVDLELGPAVYECKILHDPRHLLDFAQASVRAHFYRADNIIARARPAFEAARRTWFDYQFKVPGEPGLVDLIAYLDAVKNTANAIAALNGPALATRWFLVDFPIRAKAAGRAGLYAGLIGLLGGPQVDSEVIKTWLPAWESAFLAACEGADRPANLHPHRLLYYQGGIGALLGSGDPLAALWPLLSVWTQAAACLPEDHQDLEAWREAFTRLGLLGPGFAERFAALDAFLDSVEEVLESWARAQGVA